MRAVVALLLVGAAVRADDDPVPALLVRLDSTTPAERAVATRTLGRLDDDRALAAVARAQQDASADVRHEAATALAKAGKADETTVAILVKSLAVADWYVRWQACIALKRIGPKAEGAIEMLVAALGDATADVSREAALALATIGPKDPRTVAALVAAIEGGVGDRAGIFHAVSVCGPAAAATVPVLLRVLKDPAAKARDQASLALRSVAPGDLDICAELLGAEDPGARAFGVRGLADAPTESAFALLDRAARDGSPVVRAAVAEAAKEIGRKALPSVVPLLSDEQRRVRRAAEEAVEALGAPELAALVFERRPTWGPGLRLFTLDYDGSEALFRTLSDKDCGEGILKALSTMDLGGSQSGIESELSGWTSSAKRRCAALILPRIATDKERAVRALKEAIASEAADADFVEVAVKSLRELEK